MNSFRLFRADACMPQADSAGGTTGLASGTFASELRRRGSRTLASPDLNGV
jgi:hypothetical protein